MGTPKPASDPNDLKQFMVSGAAGDFVFHEGDASVECFIIRDGRVEILKGQQGQSRRLALLGAGDFFGEGALFDQPSRDVSARAITEFQLLRIDPVTFQRIVQEDPAIALSMARRLSRYLRTQRAIEVSAAPAAAPPRERLATEDAAKTDRPRLGVLTVAGVNQEFVLAARAQWTVGRVGSAGSHKPDIDLTPLDAEQSVSRRHATILCKSGRFLVREERGVANGTFVDGERIDAGHEVELTDGVRVWFGLVETVFTYRDA
jgi:pSer/pThr/pTyr-binding forkhead associated (FHA) protein